MVCRFILALFLAMLTRLLAYSLTRLLAYSLTRLLAYSLTRLLAYSLTRLLAMISSYGLALRFLTLVYRHDCSLSDPNRLLHLPASDLQHSASL
ncbi:hypothetical protein [Shewanella frigidimarina]|uniref:hypothetical protein n=1 Tax=Shewanella frigidimarina TaxID=56812 RepID=UPI003D78BBB0